METRQMNRTIKERGSIDMRTRLDHVSDISSLKEARTALAAGDAETAWQWLRTLPPPQRPSDLVDCLFRRSVSCQRPRKGNGKGLSGSLRRRCRQCPLPGGRIA